MLLFALLQITVDDKGRKHSQSGAENQNQCYYCNQVFQNANSLRRHCRQAHGKDRCHVCGVCNKAFKRATHLKVGGRPQQQQQATGGEKKSQRHHNAGRASIRARNH